MPGRLQRELDERGLAVVQAAVPSRLLSALARAVDRLYDGERAAGRLAADGSLQLLGAVARDEAFLTDVSQPGRGNLLVIPGSHRRNRLPGRERGARPRGTVPILAEPGTVVFDRRLWHARSDNRSALTRKVVFLAYTYRWIRPRDDPAMPLAARAGRSPVRRQLLGEGTSATGYWIPTDEDVPLRAAFDGS